MDMVNRKRYNSPYLGIKTSVVRQKEDRKWFLVPRPNGEDNCSNAEILAKEIADEVYTRPNIRKLYEKISRFDIESFLDSLDCFKDNYQDVKQVYAFVWNTRLKLLQKTIEKNKDAFEGENKNEQGLSQL